MKDRITYSFMFCVCSVDKKLQLILVGPRVYILRVISCTFKVKNRLPSEISMHVNMLFVDVYAYSRGVSVVDL